MKFSQGDYIQLLYAVSVCKLLLQKRKNHHRLFFMNQLEDKLKKTIAHLNCTRIDDTNIDR